MGVIWLIGSGWSRSAPFLNKIKDPWSELCPLMDKELSVQLLCDYVGCCSVLLDGEGTETPGVVTPVLLHG